MLKRLYTGICLILAAVCDAQTGSTETVIHKQLAAEKEFKLAFMDTSITKTVKIAAKFDSKDGYSFSLVGKKDDQKLGKNLSFFVFEFVFVKAVEDSFKIGSAVKAASVQDVWEFIYGLNNPNSNGGIAGKLLLANKIIVFDGPPDRLRDYDKGRRLKEVYINGKGAHIETRIKARKESLFKFKRKEEKKYEKILFGPLISFLYDSLDVESENYASLYTKVNSSDNSFIQVFSSRPKYSNMLSKTMRDDIASYKKNPKVFDKKTARKKVVEDSLKWLNEQTIIYRKDSLMFKNDTVYVNKTLNTLIQSQSELGNYLDSCTKNNVCTIKNVEVQFERGFIEKIKVWINYKDGAYIFENIYAIGFSSFLNYKSLSKIRLFIRNKEFTNQPYIYLSDVIRDYDNRLANYTRDYSPADTTFIAEPDKNSDIVLNRESYINIFDAKIFTDLNGTKKSNPNGLFQIELSKRFNINTARVQLGSKRSDVGIANYVNVFAAVNKIEQNNRYLTLHNANVTKNGEVISPNYATNIDFARYENYTAGFALNGALFDVPDGKFTLYADLGIKYAYLNIADSVTTSKGLIKNPYYFPEAHTVTFSLPKITLELFSESRINIFASYYHNYTFLFSNNAAKQVVSYQKSDLTDPLLEKRARRSNVFELTAKLMPSKDRNTHVFARFRFYTQSGDANTSFSQIQLGYSYNWTINR